MCARRSRAPWVLVRGMTFSVIGLLAVNLNVGWTTPAERGSTASVGQLSIESDPEGASVYVDGQLVGQTPVNVGRLPAGDHRVRLVKDGYLENGRLVTVSPTRSNAFHVRLTRHAVSTDAASQVSPVQGGGGGSKKKWIYIGAAAGGGAAAAYIATHRNSPPVAGTVVVSPAIGLAGGTAITLTAQGASDPDGDPLDYTWDFGDGSSGSGQSTTHVYNNAGAFNATVTVGDGKGHSASATGSVTIRSLTGSWRGTLVGAATTSTLTQTGTSVTGTTSLAGLSGTVSGTVSSTSPRIRLTYSVTGFQPWTFTGDPSADVNSWTGAANASGFSNDSWPMTRS